MKTVEVEEPAVKLAGVVVTVAAVVAGELAVVAGDVFREGAV